MLVLRPNLLVSYFVNWCSHICDLYIIWHVVFIFCRLRFYSNVLIYDMMATDFQLMEIQDMYSDTLVITCVMLFSLINIVCF